MAKGKKKARTRKEAVARLQEEFRKGDKLLHENLEYTKKHLDKLWEYASEARERLQDLEIQVNLITRLLTSLCLDVLNIKPRALRRMIKRVEKEAIADSQVMHLEELFRLEHRDKKEGEGKPGKE